MANSVVKLYYVDRNGVNKNWELIPNKLLIVEDIAAYLATKSALTINNFQYQKNELELGINVEISQTYAQPKSSLNFKYVSIQNNDELIHYYFVKRAYWRSKDCVRFDLVMDVLNTFQEGEDYSFKESTKIIREHKDRFILNASSLTIKFADYTYTENLEEDMPINFKYEVGGQLFLICTGTLTQINELTRTISFNFPSSYSRETIEAQLRIEGNRHFLIESSADTSKNLYFQTLVSYKFGGQYFRKIDYISENIIPVLEKKQTISIVNPQTLLSQNWYLLYKNQNEPSDSLVNPVECYLIPEYETAVNVGNITSGRVPINAFQSGSYYGIKISYNTSNTITLDSGASIGAPSESYLDRMIFISRDDNNKLVINAYDCDRVDPNASVPGYVGTYESSYIQLNVVPQEYVILSNMPPLIAGNMRSAYNVATKYYWTNTALSTILSSIDSLDRTDAKLIKLIKLPYCPYNFTISGNKINLSSDTNWLFTSLIQSSSSMIALKLKNTTTKLSAEFTPYVNLLSDLQSDIPENADLNDLRISNLEIESKLYHSDFFRETLVYDSFAWYMQLEKLYLPYYYTAVNRVFKIKFDVTSTINSKFLFTFTPYTSYKDTENFANILTIARNNEEVLYNVPYINYVRTGFNYDVKAKNLSLTSNMVGLGLSAASIGVSLALPSVPLKVAGVVGSLVSLAMSAKSVITTAISNENSMQQKITQLKNQAASVAGSDDIDLMSVYADNRMKYMLYMPNDEMRKMLFNLFFYAGYASIRMGLPNHNTRVNFDYLECEASIQKISSIPEECLNELIGSFKNGVTYLHKTSRASNKWDFEQKYENWERNIVEA